MKTAEQIRIGLQGCKAAGMPFDAAWRAVVGDVPPRGGRGDESFARATYRYMRAAYLDVGPLVQLTAAVKDAAA